MEKGKLIVVEGTDCSGKETQTKRLVERLKQEKMELERLYYPMYNTPTGRIVGGPYLGKDYICEGWFQEGAAQVDPKVASLYFAADRRYNIHYVLELLKKGTSVILDRYVESNMAHQGGKIEDIEKRHQMYKWLEQLEYHLLELPKPDATIFLYMPYQYALELKKGRIEKADQHEASIEHLKNAEQTYLELARLYHFNIVNCVRENQIRTIDDIHEEVYEIAKQKIKRY